jgi:gamma-glutamyltranspeptidase / glutathione hydrolase
MSARGVVAAGHPVTAEAGAGIMREGGNAVDAAVASVLASCVAEGPLTGLGAGGYMLVHTRAESVLLDFFVAAPGLGGEERSSELDAVPVWFTPDTPQTFHVGAASCGVPGTPAGLEEAVRRFGSVPLSELARPAAALARDGVEVNAVQAYVMVLLEPVLTGSTTGREVYAPAGSILREGDTFRFPALGDAIERFGAEGAAPFYEGELGRAISQWVLDRGGTLGPADLASYEPIAREPLRAGFAGRDVLTNPPPSAGGLLIAYVLDVLERVGRHDLASLVGAMDDAQAARDADFLDGLVSEGFSTRFLEPAALDEAARRVAAGGPPRALPGSVDGPGSTTHITAVDAEGVCASVTCSNGIGSGLIVPGTGVHVNNMMGEQDLNPLGFHRHRPGRRMPSMMAPTIALHAGALELALGSGGSNRIRSAITQTVIGLLAHGRAIADAVESPRVHCEDGAVQAEPGSDEAGLRSLEDRGYEVFRWAERNVFFGGVHAVVRDPDSGELTAAGDGRRGGAVAYA